MHSWLRDRIYISWSLIFRSCRIAPRNLNFCTTAKVKEGKITMSKASIFALARDRVIYIEITPSGKRIDWRISRCASVRLAHACVCFISPGCVYDEGYIYLSFFPRKSGLAMFELAGIARELPWEDHYLEVGWKSLFKTFLRTYRRSEDDPRS